MGDIHLINEQFADIEHTRKLIEVQMALLNDLEASLKYRYFKNED
jgi:hypothetical protein